SDEGRRGSAADSGAGSSRPCRPAPVDRGSHPDTSRSWMSRSASSTAMDRLWSLRPWPPSHLLSPANRPPSSQPHRWCWGSCLATPRPPGRSLISVVVTVGGVDLEPRLHRVVAALAVRSAAAPVSGGDVLEDRRGREPAHSSLEPIRTLPIPPEERVSIHDEQ